MKKVLGLLMLTILTLSACNNNSRELDKEQYQGKRIKYLKIERHFDVKPEKVFEAFTNPDEMIVWWTPDTEFDIDLKVGSQYTITRKEGETNLVMQGKYLEVEQPNKLIYTCGMPDFSPIMDTISVDIQPDGKGGSRLTFIQKGKGIEEELKQLSEGAKSQSEKGWNQGFDLMVQAWEQTKN